MGMFSKRSGRRFAKLAPSPAGSLALVLIGVVLAGCTTTTANVTRYTWTSVASANSDPRPLDQLHVECLKKVNSTYVPNLYGGGMAIKKTLYKDCIEQHGYAKAKTEDVPHPADWDADSQIYRLCSGLICGSDQTCVLWNW